MDGNRYMEEFIRLSSAPDILQQWLFPNCKEITETFGCYNAVRQNLWDFAPPHDPKVKFFSVGDGRQPRTSATFAYRTKWMCYAIDPNLSFTGVHPHIQRLVGIKSKVEEIQEIKSDSVVVIAMVHSHAPLEKTVEKLKGLETYLVSIPCCVPHDKLFGKKPDIEYVDNGILSDKNVVKVWKIK